MRQGKRKDFVWPRSNPKLAPIYHPSYVQRMSFKPFDLFKLHVQKAVAERFSSRIDRPPTNYVYPVPIALAENLLSGKKVIALDLETDRAHTKISMIGLCTKPGDAFSVNWNKEVAKRLAPFMAAADIVKVMHNSAFDYKVMSEKGFEFNGLIWCTMVGASLVHSHFPVGLAVQGPTFANIPQWKHLASVNESLYNCIDTDAALRLYEFQRAVFATRPHSFLDHVERIIMPARIILTDTEMEGMRVDLRLRQKLEWDLQDRHAALEERWEEVAPGVNPRSGPQKVALFFGKLMLKPVGRTKTGNNPSLDKKALAKLYKKYPDVEALQILQQLGSVAQNLKQRFPVVDDNEHVHPHYKLHKATTGRSSSGKDNDEPDKDFSEAGNFQNIPLSYRKMYIPDDPHTQVLIEADYKGIEFHILAALAKDKPTLEMIKDTDVHAMLAVEVYGGTMEEIIAEYKAAEDPKDTRRDRAKHGRHGSSYGAQAPRLSQELSTPELKISVQEAQALLDGLEKMHPITWRYRRQLIRTGIDQGYLDNAYGRRMYFPGRQPDANEILAFAPQSTALDMALVGLVRLDEMTKQLPFHSRLLTFTHDSFLLEVDTGHVEDIKKQITNILEVRCDKIMEGFIPRIDFKVGPNWGEMK